MQTNHKPQDNQTLLLYWTSIYFPLAALL